MPLRTPVVMAMFLFLLATNLLAQPTTSPAAKQVTCLVIPIKGVIGEDFTSDAMTYYLKQADKLHPTVVILEVNTPGGAVAHADRIIDQLIEHKGLRFIAFVRQGLSAGAAISLACPEIYVTDVTTFGAAVSFLADRSTGLPIQLPTDVAEKEQSWWRADCRKAAEYGGHPAILAEAMVDSDFAITMTVKNGKPVLERDGTGTLLKAKGRILTLTGREAVTCGLAAGDVPDLAGLAAKLGMSGWTLLEVPAPAVPPHPVVVLNPVPTVRPVFIIPHVPNYPWQRFPFGPPVPPHFLTYPGVPAQRLRFSPPITPYVPIHPSAPSQRLFFGPPIPLQLRPDTHVDVQPRRTDGPILTPDEAIDALGARDLNYAVQGAQFLCRAAMDKPEDRVKAREAIIPLLSVNDAGQRAQFAKAFRRFAIKEDVPRLVDMVESHNDNSGFWGPGIAGLMRLDPATGRKLFEERYDDFFFRCAAVSEFNSLGPRYEDSLIPLLDSRQNNVRTEICGVLGNIGTRKSIVAIEEALSKYGPSDFFLRGKANESIEKIRKRTDSW